MGLPPVQNALGFAQLTLEARAGCLTRRSGAGHLPIVLELKGKDYGGGSRE